MAPAAKLNLISASSLFTSTRFRVQGWDPVLIISQIVALQALHYLILGLLSPIVISLIAGQSDLLSSEGGVPSVSLVLDWRQFLGRSSPGLPRRVLASLANQPFAHIDLSSVLTTDTPAETISQGLLRVAHPESARGWATALSWALASLADIPVLYHLVRRPTHILDHALTLVFIHIILTTYYAGAFPLSLFFWIVVSLTAILQIVIAEQWCVYREMGEGFTVPLMPTQKTSSSLPSQELSTRPVRTGRTLSGSGAALLGINLPSQKLHAKSYSTSFAYSPTSGSPSHDMEMRPV